MTFPSTHLFFEDFFDDFFFGTLPPSLRASDKPIAIACFLLVTFLPDLPLFKVPSLRSCIAFLTFFCAFLPYLAIIVSPFSVLICVTLGKRLSVYGSRTIPAHDDFQNKKSKAQAGCRTNLLPAEKARCVT